MNPNVQIDIWNYISLRNCGKQPQSDIVQWLHENSTLSLIFGRLIIGHHASEGLCSCNIFRVMWCRFIMCWLRRAFFNLPV